MSSRDEPIPAEILLSAYASGYFPMAESATGPIQWYTADPRAVLPLDPFHVPRRLRRALQQAPFTYSLDRAFETVIRACAERPSTWISEGIVRSYCRLHSIGRAHSVEVWSGERLVGGLYGVHLGAVFFGESMFHREADASKAALVHLADHLVEQRFQLLEIQMITPLTAQFGARTIAASEYLPRLRRAVQSPRDW